MSSDTILPLDWTPLGLACNTQMVDSADTPAPEHARHRRAPILLVGVGALLLTAALVGGILGTKPRQRRGDKGPAPSLNSVQIVEALMLANQMELSGTAARATAAPSSAVPVQTQRSQPGEGGTSTESGPLASIKSFLSWPKAQQVVNKPAPEGMPADAVITEGWKQLVAAGGDRGPGGRGVICYPTNGTEIEHMVGRQSPCNVLVLRAGPDREYRIGRTLNVSTPKVLVGNPVNMPVLNCSGGLERLWDSKYTDAGVYGGTDLARIWLRFSIPFSPNYQSNPAAAWTRASLPWCVASAAERGQKTRCGLRWEALQSSASGDTSQRWGS